MDIYFEPTVTRLIINDEIVSLPILKPFEAKYNLQLNLSGNSEYYDRAEIKFCLLNTRENINIARSCKLKAKNKIEIFNTFYDYSSSDVFIVNEYEALKDGFAFLPIHFRCFDLGVLKVNEIIIALKKKWKNQTIG